jgi:hypothetical protein
MSYPPAKYSGKIGRCKNATPIGLVHGFCLRRICNIAARSKQAWFDENGNRLPTYTIERHVPDKIEAKESNEIDDLKR